MNAPFKATSRTFAAPIAGSGTVAERLVMVQASPRFQIGSGFRARLTVDPRHRGAIALHIRADDNVLSRVFAGLRAGAIAVELERGAYCRLSELSVEATVPALSELVALHAAHVCASGLTGSGVSLRADHASRIEVSGEVERWGVQLLNASRGRVSLGRSRSLEVQLAAASTLALEGRAERSQLVLSGASRLGGDRFETLRAQVELSGLSSARLCAREVVTGRVRDLSKLSVVGGATVTVDGKVGHA